MTFTTEPPTTPGFYAWRRNADDTPEALTILAVGSDLHNPTYDANPAYMGGQWCRLVPAEEVEKAWNECCDFCDQAIGRSESWKNSRAEQVAEGKI